MCQSNSVETRVLIVRESASAAVTWGALGHGDMVVLGQQLDEPVADFAARALHRIDDLALAAWRPRVAVLAVSPILDEAELRARAEMASALLGHLDAAPDA